MKFLQDETALLLDKIEDKTLVISDLHLGIEYEIYTKGITIPPRIKKQRGRIFRLIRETDVEKLVLLGDVKHNVPQTSIGEKENLPKFFKDLKEEVEVHIVKGNHDGNIEKLVGEVEVHPTSGFRQGEFYFNHGHAWPEKEIFESRTLIQGHSHPAIEFKDKLGFSSVMPCWLKGRLNTDKLQENIGTVETSRLESFVIVPAFNRMITGMPVNREDDESLLGPLLENGIIDVEECKAYLLDGTFLGRVSEI
jgi:hypothetical protein